MTRIRRRGGGGGGGRGVAMRSPNRERRRTGTGATQCQGESHVRRVVDGVVKARVTCALMSVWLAACRFFGLCTLCGVSVALLVTRVLRVVGTRCRLVQRTHSLTFPRCVYASVCVLVCKVLKPRCRVSVSAASAHHSPQRRARPQEEVAACCARLLRQGVSIERKGATMTPCLCCPQRWLLGRCPPVRAWRSGCECSARTSAAPLISRSTERGRGGRKVAKWRNCANGSRPDKDTRRVWTRKGEGERGPGEFGDRRALAGHEVVPHRPCTSPTLTLACRVIAFATRRLRGCVLHASTQSLTDSLSSLLSYLFAPFFFCVRAVNPGLPGKPTPCCTPVTT